MGVRSDRAAKLIEAYERGEDAIRFIRATADTVLRHKDLFGDDEADRFLSAAIGEMWTVCAERFVRHRGGFESGAQIVSHFPDEDLCYECHKAFGDHGYLIFEVNQDDGSDPTEMGRLDADFITKGKTLR